MAILNTATLLNPTGSDPSASPTATPTIVITGEMGSYRCYVDGVALGTYQPSNPYGQYNVFIQVPLSDGNHMFTFEELSPNAGGPPGYPPQPYSFSVDTRIPTAPVITKVTVGAPTSGRYPLTIQGTVTADEGVRNVRVYKGLAGIGGAGVAGTAWTVATYPPLAPGEYDITATAMDPAGNASPRSAPYRVTVGTPPAPTVPGIPTAGTGNDHSVTLKWTTPPDGGSPITTYVVTWSVQAVNLVGTGGSSSTAAAKVTP